MITGHDDHSTIIQRSVESCRAAATRIGWREDSASARPNDARRLSSGAFAGKRLRATAIECLQRRGTFSKLAAVQFQVARLFL
jgi:hypothetical protein